VGPSPSKNPSIEGFFDLYYLYTKGGKRWICFICLPEPFFYVLSVSLCGELRRILNRETLLLGGSPEVADKKVFVQRMPSLLFGGLKLLFNYTQYKTA